MILNHYKINIPTGFARPAVTLFRFARMFKSEIHLEYEGKSINLKSISPDAILEIMSLEFSSDSPFTIRAEGVDEQEAMYHIEMHLRKCMEKVSDGFP